MEFYGNAANEYVLTYVVKLAFYTLDISKGLQSLKGLLKPKFPHSLMYFIFVNVLLGVMENEK